MSVPPLERTEKRCPGCGLTKPIDEFYRASRRADGHEASCIECRRKRNQRDAEKNKAYKHAYYLAHREQQQARETQQRETTREQRAQEATQRQAERLVARLALGGKVCTVCRIFKPFDAFAPCPTSRVRDGHRGQCRFCRRDEQLRYRPRQKVVSRAHYLAHRDALRVQMATYYWAHRETEVLRRKAYYTAHRDEHLARTKAYRLIHPESVKATEDAWRRQHPERVRATRDKRRALKRATPGHYTAADLLVLYETQRGQCAYCGKTLNEQYDVEHMIPLGRTGSSNWLWNLCLSCHRCNCRKQARTAGQFFALLIRERRAKAA